LSHTTPLIRAIATQKLRLALLLLPHSKKVINHQSIDGNSCLHCLLICCSSNCDLISIARGLLIAGANPFLKNNKGKTAFDLLRSSKIISENDKLTLEKAFLTSAAQEMIKKENKPSSTKEKKDGSDTETASLDALEILIHAIRAQNASMVCILLGNPIYFTIINNNIRITEHRIHTGLQFVEITTALEEAVKLTDSDKSKKILQAILNIRTIDINRVGDDSQSTVLCQAIANPYSLNKTAVNLLLEAKADPSIKDKNGLNAFQLLLQRKDSGTLKELAEKIISALPTTPISSRTTPPSTAPAEKEVSVSDVPQTLYSLSTKPKKHEITHLPELRIPLLS